MKSSSLSVQFTVNDLDANYEVIGTSDNYSFQYNLGKGSDLVDLLGQTASKIIPLKGNYGTFEVKIFAVSDIGIRSQFLLGEVEVSPPSFDATFTFNNLRISSLQGGIEESLFNQHVPTGEGDKLIVDQQFAGKNIELNWELIAPSSHALEGLSLSTELLSDSFFSGIVVNIKTGDQIIDISTVDTSNDAIQSLSAFLNTEPTNVADDLQNYRSFSLLLDEDVFNGLNLPRDVTVDLVAVDKFGRTCTGTISGHNPEPYLNSLTQTLNGSEMSFSWATDTVDYSGMNVNVIGIPENRELFDSGDLLASKNFIDNLNSTISNDLTWDNHANYSSGDLILENGDVYRSNTDHTSSYNNRPKNDDVTWTNYGSSIDYVYTNETVDVFTFEQEQFFGYKYYYTFQVFDDFGGGDLFLLGEDGSLLIQGEEDSLLFPYQTQIKIANLRFYEREDDLVFNWEIVDQDDNAVDLVQYRAAFKEGGLPSVLGLSGSLYDVHTNQTITGLTEGNNSISLTKNEDGDTEVVYGLQTSKIFDTYEYTREINNQIYGTGGFPEIYDDFNYQSVYESGDHVIVDDQIVYKAILDSDNSDPKIKPIYDFWQKSQNYTSGESFSYNDGIYKVYQDFGPEYTDGLFDFSRTYASGDLVVSPNQYYENFNAVNRYELNDIVVYNDTLYKCLALQETGTAVTPGTDSSKWRVASLFSEIDCDTYKALSSSSGLIPINQSVLENGVLVDKWEIYNPLNSDRASLYIENYSGFVSEWETGVDFISGDLVVYSNDIWSGIQDSGPNSESGIIEPGTNASFWQNEYSGQDIIFSYSSGEKVCANGSIYKANADNPVGAPIIAFDQAGNESLSDYLGTQWIPYWQEETQYQDIIFGHAGIPQSGKRSVGIELAIVDREGDVFDLQKLSADNPPPYILSEGFNIDSLSEATKVKFNFNYALAFQEKTTKVNLYRSSDPVFDVVDENGFPLTGEGTTFVKTVIGAGDATFGQNITQIIDEPPIPSINGVDQITGYYYKILPFDDFGSGDLYGVNDNAGDLEQCLVYPKNYSNKNPNGIPGPVFRTSADDIPGPVIDLSGDTAFENYFLSWVHPSGNIQNRDQIPNDLSHYEVWMGNSDTDDKLELGSLNVFLKDEADPLEDIDFSNNSGYRRIETDIASTGPIPIEKQDPASGITNAKRIFNVPANGAEIETSYLGKTNETKYFWVRPVDFAGNKGPFTGAANLSGPEIEGVELTLGQASATDIDDFELNMTEIFGNTIALAPQPDPFDGDGSYISWPEHVLYYQGTGYLINGSGIGPNYDTQKASYIWWDNNGQADSADPDQEYVDVGLRNIYYKNINYKISSSHPAGSRDQDSNNQDYVSPDPDFGEGDFIVARLAGFPSNAAATPVYHAFANALIGTANIAEAAIVDAKINSLKADKITAGEIKGHEIVVGSRANQYGSIVTPGFTGYTNPVDGVSYPPANNGFVLSGDGTFEFRGDQGKLTLDNDGTLSLEGRLRQSNGKDYDFVDFSSMPAYVNYVETNNGYEIENNNDLVITARFRNTSISSADDVRFRMQVFNDGVINDVFSYDDFIASKSAGKYDISGFSYDVNPSSNDFIIDNQSITAVARLAAGFEGNVFGFHDIITSNSTTGDAVILYVSGANSDNETSTTIGRIIDGKAGPGGPATHFRGEWSAGEYYSGSAIRGDIVYYAPDNEFYIGREPSSPSSSSFSADLNAGKWEAFGGQFTSVATNLLLAEEAIITEKLELGTLGGGTQPFSLTSVGNGIITSPGFVGGIFDVNNNTVLNSNNYTTAGFSMGSYYDSSKSKNISFFDMGGQSVGNFDSYFRLNTDDGKIEMHSAFISGGINVTSDLGTIFDFNNYQNQDPKAVFIGGGYNNTITIPSFQNNFKSLASSIVAGGENNIEGRFSIIGGGYNNECKDNFSVIAGGWGNGMPQAGSENEGANFIGGGQSNTINGGSYQSIPGGEYNSISNNSSLVYNPALHFKDKFRLGDGINDASLIVPSWYSSWFAEAVFVSDVYGDHQFDGDSMKTEDFVAVVDFLNSNVLGWIFLSFNEIYPTKRAPSTAWFYAENLFGGSWSWLNYDVVLQGPWVWNHGISDWLYFYPNSNTVYRDDTQTNFTLSQFD